MTEPTMALEEALQKIILTHLKDDEAKPAVVLFDEVRQDDRVRRSAFVDDDLRYAMLMLINAGTVVMSPDRKLQRAKQRELAH